jgi:hypothetical protein
VPLQSPTTVDPLAQAAMVAYCGWDPTALVVDQQILLDGNGALALFLPSLYVTAVSAVTVTLVDGSTYAAQIGTGLDVSWNVGGELDWLPTATGGAGCWPEGLQNVAVTYSGGYATVPTDLQAALNSLSARMPKVTSGLTQAKIGTASMTYAQSVAQGGLLAVEQWVFDKYRIVKVA